MLRRALLLVVLLAGCRTTAAPAPTADVEPARPSVEAASEELDRGRVLLARGELAAAAAAFRESLRRQPDLLPARVSLGLALSGLGDLDAAAEELRAALRQHPDAVDARLALARVLLARQDWTAAREQLERVLAVEPERVDARFGLGVVRYAQGDLPGAIDAYRRVLAAEPRQQEARYNLALVLEVTGHGAAATAEFLAAAEAGHPQAQYFVGSAYASGLGVEPSLTQAVAWWVRAAEQGVVQAEEALEQLRLVALGRVRRPAAERQAAEQAFADYRAGLRQAFPDLPAEDGDSVGAALLRQGRVREAVTVLIREALASSEPARRLLATLYEQGVEGQLPAHDARIPGHLRGAAVDGPRPSRP